MRRRLALPVLLLLLLPAGCDSGGDGGDGVLTGFPRLELTYADGTTRIAKGP